MGKKTERVIFERYVASLATSRYRFCFDRQYAGGELGMEYADPEVALLWKVWKRARKQERGKL